MSVGGPILRAFAAPPARDLSYFDAVRLAKPRRRRPLSGHWIQSNRAQPAKPRQQLPRLRGGESPKLPRPGLELGAHDSPRRGARRRQQQVAELVGDNVAEEARNRSGRADV